VGEAKSPMVMFCYTVSLTAVTKAETLVFRLLTVQKKKLRAMIHCGEFIQIVLSATPRYGTQCEIQAKNFLGRS
jgi:hypothetical protein